MSLLKLILVLCLAVGAYKIWQTAQTRAHGQPAAVVSPNGFRTVRAPSNAPANAVMIIAPPNCPRAEGRRAAALERDLKQAGIPCQLTGNVSFDNITSQSEADGITAVMNGEVPIVFIRDRAKSNPSLGEVVAEYRSAHP